MKSREKDGKKASIAAVLGIVVGLIAGVSLSHSHAPAQTLLKSASEASMASSSGCADAVAANDTCDIQLD